MFGLFELLAARAEVFVEQSEVNRGASGTAGFGLGFPALAGLACACVK